MKRALFIDRDGTIINEPPEDFQIDSLEKLEFRRGAITSLSNIAKLGFEFVMATNQDGLGTTSFPEDTFWPAHNKMLLTLENEGIVFNDILIDRTFEHENAPTRKPRTGLFGKYNGEHYDMGESFVIGDRLTDVMLADNLGAKAILMQPEELGAKMLEEADLEAVLVTDSWPKIAEFLRSDVRRACVTRGTKETAITVGIDIDGIGMSEIETGIGFFDHMLQQIPHHGGIALQVKACGDLHVDEHHTIEDVGIVLGEAVRKALGDKRGIERYGYVLPMDESDAMVLVDFGGRIDFRWDAEFRREKIGEMPTEMFEHFFKSFAEGARCNLHIVARGTNEHHKIEGIFKAFARALKMAVKRDVFRYELPSSKGIL